MKNTIKVILGIAIFALLNLSSSIAQNTFLLYELQNLCDFSSNDFETYALEKGFSNLSKFSDENIIILTSDISRVNGMHDQICRSTGSTTIISFNTTDKQYYLNFKDYLSSYGYKYLKEEDNEVSGSMTKWFYYSNKVYTSFMYINNNSGVTWYNISLFKY